MLVLEVLQLTRVLGSFSTFSGSASVVRYVFTMGARSFTELHAWQLANELKRRVYALVDSSRARHDDT